MFRIYPYKMGSASVRALKQALGALIIRTENSRYRPRDEHIIVNWGNSNVPNWDDDAFNIINHPLKVGYASNKLRALSDLSSFGIEVPKYTTDKRHAEYWIADGYKVFARHKLTGHSGEGIEVCDSVVPDAPLYTRGIQNHGEYRVHVFDGEVILYQKKSRRLDEDGEVIAPDEQESDVRNLASGWVYRTGNLRRLERIEDIALNTIDVLGLDFGAVDIIMDDNGNVFVLEVNTAPGLGNEATLQAYTNAIEALVE